MSKRPKVPYRHGRNMCIFCGGASETKISDEHIWPEWAHDKLPATIDHGIVAGKIDKKDRTSITHRNDKRQGAVTNFRVRKVCKACNTVWMSAYEQKVRHFLEPMMLGQKVSLNEHDQQLLVEYLTYKMMVLDAGLPDRFIPPEVVHAFYADRSIPEGMDIHILNCTEGAWQIGMRLIGAAFTRDEMLDPKMPPNVKSFAVGFGFLFVYAVFRREGEFDFHFEPGAAIRLWPPFNPMIRWPTIKPINSAQAEFVAMAVWRTGDAPDITDFGVHFNKV